MKTLALLAAGWMLGISTMVWMFVIVPERQKPYSGLAGKR